MNTMKLKEEQAAHSDDYHNLMNIINNVAAGKSGTSEEDLHKYMKRKVGSIINSSNLDEIKIEEN